MTIENPPVSVKAAVRCGERWVLLRNSRHEWELPGGRIDKSDADLQAVVRRECREELGADIEVGELVDAYLFEVIPGRRVTIVCFAASLPVSAGADLQVSGEHHAVEMFTTRQLDAIKLHPGYRRALAKAEALCVGLAT